MQNFPTTIAQTRKALLDGDFTILELVQAHIERIKERNPELNAFVTTTEEQALQQAEAIQQEYERTGTLPPLAGIPYSAKDLFCTKNIRTTAGANILDSFIPPFDATAVRRLNQAGAVLIGKTNCDAFGHGSSTQNTDYGITKNPVDTAYVPGGSSGGSAAAVAAGMGLFSLGTDTGGSIRQPASFCGIPGLKVTYGRVSRSGVVAYASSLDTIGPLATTVEDIALVLDVLAGHDPLDATTPDVAVPSYSSVCRTPPRKLTIGLVQECADQEYDAEVKAAFSDAIATYERLGATVKTVSLPHLRYAIAAYYLIATAETSSNLSRYDGIRYGYSAADANSLLETYTHSREQGFTTENKKRIMLGTYALSAGYYDAYYKKAMQVRTLIKQDFEKLFADVDVLCMPTSPVLPFKIGENISDPVAMYLVDAFTVPANLAGVPSLQVPIGRSKEHQLPIGMQILGPQFSEDLLLSAGHWFETA